MLKKKKMLTFDLDNEKITKQEYENRLSILEFQYTQDLAEIERLAGEELVKMYETYGKVMDYININTGELENSITRFLQHLDLTLKEIKGQLLSSMVQVSNKSKY